MMMETTPLLLKKNDNTTKGKIYQNAKHLSCVFLMVATFAVTTTFSSSPSSSSSEKMKVGMKGYAARAAPLFLRGRTTTKDDLDAAKLGEESPTVITLSAACSPVDKLSFDPGNWENVGAKLISKSMSSDFAFENVAGTESRLKILDANLRWMGAPFVQRTLHRKNRPSVDRFRWLRARRRLLTVIYHFTIESTTDLR